MNWTTGSVAVDGTSLFYTRTGGNKPVLLLLHGITDSGLCWSRVAMDLEADFDVLMPDARGHGLSRSAGTDVSVGRLAADAAGILDGLGLRHVLVFGHSMGAITAVGLAATRPDLVAGLVLEDPPIGPLHDFSPEFIRGWQADLTTWPKLSPQERRLRCAAENPTWHPLETDPLAEAKANVDPGVLELIGDPLRAFDWQDAFRRFGCPGLLVTGDKSLGAIIGPDVAAEAIGLWPAGRVVHIAGAGHCVHRDRWDDAMAPIRSFLHDAAGVAG
jgi:pimeloyl-ACP methyl ester carboxylesterase